MKHQKNKSDKKKTAGKALEDMVPYINPKKAGKFTMNFSNSGGESVERLEHSKIFNLGINSVTQNGQLIMENGTSRCIINVQPVNVDYFDVTELETIKSAIIAALSSIPQSNRVGIYMQKEKLNIDRTFTLMEARKANLDNVWQTEIQEHNIKNLQGSVKNITKISRFYMCLESNERTFEQQSNDLIEQYRTLDRELNNGGLRTSRLDKHEVLNLLYNRLNKTIAAQIDLSHDAEIGDVLPNTAMLYREGDVVQIENTFSRQIYFKAFRANVPEYSWLKSLLRLDKNIMVGITLNGKQGNLGEALDKAFFRETNSKANPKLSEAKQSEKQLQGAADLYDRLSDDNLNLYDVNITVSIEAENRRELNDDYKAVLGTVNGMQYRVNNIVRKEFDGYMATLPILVDNAITRHYTYNLTTDDVAAILPFSSNEYIDEAGVVYGKNVDSEALFILDRAKKSYNNPHLAIVADSGSGKTYSMSTWIMRELPIMDHTIVIDVVGNFKEIFPFANHLEFSPHSGIVINPFHIRNLWDSKDENTAPITSKTLDLLTFFKWIIPDMTPSQISTFDILIRSTYERAGFSDIEKPAVNTEFPTFTDFKESINQAIEASESEKRKQELIDLRDILEPFMSGSYAKMMNNGQTNYDYDQVMTILDVSRLNKQLIAAVYDLVLSDLWKFCTKDGSNDTGNPPLKSIVLDEAHELARSENPQTLDFIATKLLKQGRKYNVFVTTATQGLSDYLVIEKYGQAILDNSYFKFFMRLGESDHYIAQRMYKFTTAEMKLLTGSGIAKEQTKGRGIFSVGGYKVPIKTFAYPSELKTINHNDYERAVKEGKIPAE